MLELETDRDLRGETTFGVPARCEQYARIDSPQCLRDVLEFVRRRDLPLRVLGGGSNVLLTRDLKGVVARMAIPGIEFEETDRQTVLVTAGAGVNWHTLVGACLARGVYGLENLALIPGSTGAAPIQNIGAYGVELSDVFHSLEAMDATSGQMHTMNAVDCRFGYRDSAFKHELAGRRVITRVTLRLGTHPDPVLDYPALTEYLQRHDLPPEPEQIFRAVCAIRRSKLPDPARIGNAGSFFRNPVLSRAQYDSLQERISREFGVLPFFPVANSPSVKVPAAWLIERAGWKGYREGDAGVHDRQALVLVNHGSATGAEIAALAGRIAGSVQERFGVRLEEEVTIL